MVRPSLRTFISRMPSDRYALMVAALYALLGFFYIFVSDHVLAWFVDDPKTITWLQTLKGWTFIGLTGALLLELVRFGRERVRRAETRLRAADSQFRQMIEGTNDGAWTFDVHGRTEYVNPTMAGMLGETQARMIGRDVRDFIAPHVSQFLERALPGRQDQEAMRFDCELRRSDGSTLWALVSATLLANPEGRSRGGILMVRDITRRRAAEKAAEQSLQMQRALLNELDHRVRNNLSSLSALIDFSVRDAGSVDEFASMMRGRVQAIAKAHGLASRASETGLDFARLVQEMAPSSARGRLTVDGPAINVAVGQIASLALLMHELMARSERSGALSRPQGDVDLSWMIASASDGAMSVHLRLREKTAGGDAPIGMHPDALIEGLVKDDLGGHAVTSFEGDTLVTEVTMRIGYASGATVGSIAPAPDPSPPKNGAGGSQRVRAAR